MAQKFDSGMSAAIWSRYPAAAWRTAALKTKLASFDWPPNWLT